MSPIPSFAARLLAPLVDARRATAMLAFAFVVTSAGVLATPRAAFAWGDNEFSSGSESMLISLQNEARASAGKKALKLDTDLRQIARWRSKDMIERDYFSHTIKGTDRQVFWYMQHEYGYCFKVAGENIGTVKWPGASEEEATNWVFDAFMNSQGHRDNIMGKAWDVVAVGAYKGPDDKFMWTVLFADCVRVEPGPHAEADAQAHPEAHRSPRRSRTSQTRRLTRIRPTTPSRITRPRRTTSPETSTTIRSRTRRRGRSRPWRRRPTRPPRHRRRRRWSRHRRCSRRPRPPRRRRHRPTDRSSSRHRSGRSRPVGFRVVDPPQPTGFVDSILGPIVAQLFGG